MNLQTGRGRNVRSRPTSLSTTAGSSRADHHRREDLPPELLNRRGEQFSLPASFDPLKVYTVTLGKSVEFAGRWLSPSKEYTMTGATCTET